MDRFNWSQAEKKVAKRAFDAALAREYAALLQKLKDMSEKAEKPEDIWTIHDFLSRQRKAMDEKYDYRYSQLIFVFGRLIRENWIDEAQLEGLNEEKLKAIRYIASL
ncbi:MAG: hypothetical protein ABSB19_19460 [Methylomonas sp.]|jgi:hypothetical protein